jgi:hypothetical protein
MIQHILITKINYTTKVATHSLYLTAALKIIKKKVTDNTRNSKEKF